MRSIAFYSFHHICFVLITGCSFSVASSYEPRTLPTTAQYLPIAPTYLLFVVARTKTTPGPRPGTEQSQARPRPIFGSSDFWLERRAGRPSGGGTQMQTRDEIMEVPTRGEEAGDDRAGAMYSRHATSAQKRQKRRVNSPSTTARLLSALLFL